MPRFISVRAAPQTNLYPWFMGTTVASTSGEMGALEVGMIILTRSGLPGRTQKSRPGSPLAPHFVQGPIISVACLVNWLAPGYLLLALDAWLRVLPCSLPGLQIVSVQGRLVDNKISSSPCIPPCSRA